MKIMNVTGGNRKVFNGIDEFKLIAACLIVLLHAVETGNVYAQGIKYVFTWFAVPFFFIVSGFFLYLGLERAENKKSYILRYGKHILGLIVIWVFIVYLPFTIQSYLKTCEGYSKIIFLLAVFRSTVIIGSGPYWYIVSLFWSLPFLYLCYRRNDDKCLCATIGTGLLCLIIYTCFQDVLSGIPAFQAFFAIIRLVFFGERNFLMYGIPFMGIGYLIAKYNITIKTKTAVILLIVSTVLRIVEYILPKVYISTFFETNKLSVVFILQAISYFMIAKNVDTGVSDSQSLTMRQLSSWIYFTHAIILYNVLDPLLKKTGICYKVWMIPVKYGIVLSACLILFIVLNRTNRKVLAKLING